MLLILLNSIAELQGMSNLLY